MVYRIFLEDDNKIELPNDLNLEERIKLCEDIISQYEEYFTYEVPTTRPTQFCASEKVKMRLSIMGEYIYTASKEGLDDTVITPWRKRRNKYKEVIFSELER